MHMADALLSPQVAGVMFGASIAAAGISIKELKKENDSHKLPLMAVCAALVFAGQMVNYAIPGTGSSGHLSGAVLLSAILGPYGAFLSMFVILTIQAVFFADGGLMAIGANLWNMAFYGCFAVYWLIIYPLMKKTGKTKLILASVLASILSLQLGAFSVVLETKLSGITEIPFGTFLVLMQPVHLTIGLFEGLITSSILLFIYEARPEILYIPSLKNEENQKSKLSFKTTVIVLAVTVLITAGGLSLVASRNPDGLEWSLFGNTEEGYSQNLGLDENNYGYKSSAQEKAEALQNQTALLPDYNFPDSDSDMGTSFSGIVGAVIVAVLTLGLSFFIKLFKKKKNAVT